MFLNFNLLLCVLLQVSLYFYHCSCHYVFSRYSSGYVLSYCAALLRNKLHIILLPCSLASTFSLRLIFFLVQLSLSARIMEHTTQQYHVDVYNVVMFRHTGVWILVIPKIASFFSVPDPTFHNEFTDPVIQKIYQPTLLSDK